MGMLRRVIAYPTTFYPYNLSISLLAEIGIAGIVMTIGSALVEFLTYSSSRTIGVSANTSTPSISLAIQEEKGEIFNNFKLSLNNNVNGKTSQLRRLK